MPRRPEQTDFEGDIQPATLQAIEMSLFAAAKDNPSPDVQEFASKLRGKLMRARRIVMGSTMTQDEALSVWGKFLAKNRLKPVKPHGPQLDNKRMNARLRRMTEEQLRQREEDFARDGTPAQEPKPPKEIAHASDFMAEVRRVNACP